MIFNIKNWISNNLVEKCFEYAMSNMGKLKFADQDILNPVLSNNVKYLSLKWNLVTTVVKGVDNINFSKKENIEALKKPNIIHYTTRFKPWNPKYKHPLAKEYFSYLHLTPWKNFAYEYKFKKLVFLLKKLSKI